MFIVTANAGVLFIKTRDNNEIIYYFPQALWTFDDRFSLSEPNANSFALFYETQP